MSTGPLARSVDLIVDTIGDELLVYDTSNNRAHSLNKNAAAVWKACDGTRSTEGISRYTELDQAAVELALDNLADVDLISGHQRTGISRRTVLGRMTVSAAGLAFALPVIRSITAPTASVAVSGCTRPDTCNASIAFCSGSFCNSHSACQDFVPGGSDAACSSVTLCQYGFVCTGSPARCHKP